LTKIEITIYFHFDQDDLAFVFIANHCPFLYSNEGIQFHE